MIKDTWARKTDSAFILSTQTWRSNQANPSEASQTTMRWVRITCSSRTFCSPVKWLMMEHCCRILFQLYSQVSLVVCVYEEIKDITHLPGVSRVYSTAQIPQNLSEPPQTLYDNILFPTNTCEFSAVVYSSVPLPLNSPGRDIYSVADWGFLYI